MNPTPSPGTGAPALSRRTFMMSTAAGAAGAAGTGLASAQEATATPAPPRIDTRVVINGQPHALQLEPRASLLDVLREQLGLTGAKKGCDHGQCGACTVHLDGRRVAACLTLGVKADGCAVTTIESIAAPDGTLHPMQQAFIKHDAFQCGYCTPGQICSAVGLANEGRAQDPAQIQELMSGNLCRCGAYSNIRDAIEAVVLGDKP